ncbi:TIGR04255 family protein [Thiohalomonas denitrificans]|uniref:TIGR04255 family protein n=1 Tax=Thiohalomonas denitrificans TaxID=415747 RepID=A0A1G5PTP8_9GAMM|nr:TIGR04255 family protein [Thiohalomonas denitrificans]SCZ52903.1 TIGR04255 family protein [Thiohalomonas denitrificans]
MPNLPEFGAPPLTEVVLDVQFEPLTTLSIPEIGSFWHRVKDRFTDIEQHPPLEPSIERIGVPPETPQLRFALREMPPIPRIWFLNKNGQELIQIQQDRFIRNWRRINDVNEYPRYESHVRPKFVEDYELFSRFLVQEGIGRLVPTQCEITYINHIPADESWREHCDYATIFSFWQNFGTSEGIVLEDVSANLNFLMHKEDEFVGRLRVNSRPGYRASDKMPVYVFTLTARGRPLGEGLDGVIKFFDFGRSAIVDQFTKMTTPLMHMHWRRK